jgi:hypothetical protein
MLCKVCNSSNVEIKKNNESLKIIFGPDAVYEQTTEFCNSCLCEIDITDENIRLKAIQLAEAQSVKIIIDNLQSNNYTISNIERILELPSETFSKWYEGQYSSEALTLLRLLNVFPELINIAENDYHKT